MLGFSNCLLWLSNRITIEKRTNMQDVDKKSTVKIV